MQRWEYTRVVVERKGVIQTGPLSPDVQMLKHQDMWNHLHRLGQEGWEMVSAYGHHTGEEYFEVLWFKRLVEREADDAVS